MCYYNMHNLTLLVIMIVISSGVSESISAEITVPPTGHCLDGIFKLCDWVEWTPWGECSNRCGTGVQTRRRRICCPLDIKENNVSQCVVDLCKFSMAQYRDNETCTSTKDCPPENGGSGNDASGSGSDNCSRAHTSTVGIVTIAVGVTLGVVVLTTSCICCFFLCKRWSDGNKKKRKFKRWEKRVRPLPHTRRPNMPTSFH